MLFVSVLKDGVTGGKLLNNDNLLTTFQKPILYEGVILEYSGCLKDVERINASRPLKKDLLVEVRVRRKRVGEYGYFGNCNNYFDCLDLHMRWLSHTT